MTDRIWGAIVETETLSVIIANPDAAADESLALAIRERRQRGYDIELAPTRCAGDAARLCGEWRARGAARIIAAGGDGLLNEVATAILAGTVQSGSAQQAFAAQPTLGQDPPVRKPSTGKSASAILGILPYGTANDFARANGLAPGDVATSLAVALENRPRLIDVVRCNEAFFVNSCTAGFGARITTDTQSGIKSLLGGVSYLLNALTHISELEPYLLDVESGDTRWRGEAIGFAVTNGRQAGGGVVISPEARLDDGVIDGLLFPAMTLGGAAYMLQQYSTGEQPANSGDMVLLQGRRLRIHADRPLPITLDGEPREEQELLLTVCPGALAMALPADSPLLQNGSRPSPDSGNGL